MDIFHFFWLLSFIFGKRAPTRAPALVSTEWVQDYIHKNPNPTRSVRVIETSFNPSTSSNYTTEYAQGHIPQAVYFDLYKCVNGTEEILKELPELKCITDYIRVLGVWHDTHVIVYTRSAVTRAFRTWWTFRIFGHYKVSVLDGGFQKWVADGFNLSTSFPLVKRSTFEGRLNTSMLRTYDDMVANLETKREQVIDSRSPDSIWVFNKAYDSGMIPGAKMVTYTTLFNTSEGTMKSKLELKEIFKKSGIDLELPMVTYCNTGMKSTVVTAAIHLLGYEAAMYYVKIIPEYSKLVHRMNGGVGRQKISNIEYGKKDCHNMVTCFEF